MKKGVYILLAFGIILLGLLIPENLSAVSGCCSSHGGVNCAAGPQANGRVICYDGWRGSSCTYSGMVKCQGYVTPTTPAPTTAPAPVYIATPIPTVLATIAPTSTPKPTVKPTPAPSPTETPSPEPTQESEVLGEETEAPTPTPEPLTKGDIPLILGLVLFFIALPIFAVIQIVKRIKAKLSNKKKEKS